MNYNNDDDYESDELAAFWADRRRRALGKKSFLSKGKKSFKEETTRDVLEKLLADYDDEMNYNPDRRKTLFPQPEMLFDGRKFGVYYNGIPQLEVDSMSGQKGYQNRKSLSISDNGPIPEGKWNINPQKLQKYLTNEEKERKIEKENPEWLEKQKIRHNLGFNYRWMDKPDAWGNYRVILEPDKNTETYRRKGIFLHGGTLLGSAGCIDTGHNIDNIAPYIKKAKKPINLEVRYDEDDWER